MAKGRPRKWLATTAAAPETTGIKPDQFEKDVEGYVELASCHRLTLGPVALQAYARSQRSAGCDLGAIANRVESLVTVREGNVSAVIEAHRVKRLVSEMRKAKANAGGPKRKPLADIGTLMSWCIPTTNQRDLQFQSVWFLLIATGCRPHELHSADVRLTGRSADPGVEIRFNGRKQNSSTGANYLHFSSEHSAEIPAHIREHLRKAGRIPKIGTPQNIASCINSWLQKFHGRYQGPPQPAGITSTCPRVRMDNVLRSLVDESLMPVHVYEALMGHTVQTSDASYRR